MVVDTNINDIVKKVQHAVVDRLAGERFDPSLKPCCAARTGKVTVRDVTDIAKSVYLRVVILVTGVPARIGN